MSPKIKPFFDAATNSFSYVVSDGANAAAIIDPVLSYDAASGRTSPEPAEAILRYLAQERLEALYILETHIHADHLSAGALLRECTGAKTGAGAAVTKVQETFAPIFGIEPSFRADGSQFDRLLEEGDVLEIGQLTGRVMATPGHTPACVTYVFDDAMFVGDTLFMPDFGTARCDFPGGDARQLYRSIQKIFAAPDETRLFVCHDYLTGDRKQIHHVTSIGEQKNNNVHIHSGVSEDDFVTMRQERDVNLCVPKLLIPAVQFNIRAGEIPNDDNGLQFLKIPLNKF